VLNVLWPWNVWLYAQATETRDALAKTLYDRLFRWIVHVMNSRMGAATPNIATTRSAGQIVTVAATGRC